LAGFSNKGFALFSAYTTKHGRELWRTNGTKKGTMLVRNIMRYNSDSEPSGFHLHRGLIYFSAESDGRGRELWRTNGTKKGTALVDDINRRRLDSNPGQFISMGPRLFFTATKDNQRMAFYLAPSGRARLVDPGGFQVNGGFFKAGARIVWYTYGRGFRSTNTNLNVLAFGLNITAAKKIDSAEICQ
jgi:ELWxxDGT repeat protein